MKIIRYLDADHQIHYATDGRRIDGDIYGQFRVTGEPAAVHKLLAPVAPAAIWAIGLNYWQHAAETNAKTPDFPILFAKGLNSVQNPGDPIELPRYLRSDQVDYECELAVVIGKACKNVRRQDALQYVLGYTAANDVSARDWQKNRGGGQWCRGKTFDTFCPLGPCLVTADAIPSPATLRLRTLVNDDVLQDSTTGDMIFDVPALIEFLSGSTTLLPGTVILTGTPQGVGMARQPPRWLRAGDVVTIEIDQIGRLTNPVVDEQP